jgi:hypothetical protein
MWTEEGAAFKDRSYVRHVGLPCSEPYSPSHSANNPRMMKRRTISIMTRVVIIETLIIGELREREGQPSPNLVSKMLPI